LRGRRHAEITGESEHDIVTQVLHESSHAKGLKALS
jgi:hypothetical protein